MWKIGAGLLNKCLSLGSVALIASCTHVASLRVYPDEVSPDSLRLVQVMLVGTRSEIISEKEWHAALLQSGVPDSDIQDGSMAVGRIWCCGGPVEMSDRQAFYVPPNLKVVPFDIVEIRAGREPVKGGPGQVNVATRIVRGANDTSATCRWEPQNTKLWMRILYCDWMPQEGWVELKTALRHTWFKPLPGRAPQ
jgi:hypothetical protein